MDLIALKTCSVKRSSIRDVSALQLAPAGFFFPCSFACNSMALPISFASYESSILVPHSHMTYLHGFILSEDTFAFFDVFEFFNRINSVRAFTSLINTYKFCELKQNCFVKAIFVIEICQCFNKLVSMNSVMSTLFDVSFILRSPILTTYNDITMYFTAFEKSINVNCQLQ